MIEKNFNVSKEDITGIQDFLNSWCEENFISQKISTKIAICSDEILSNIIFYSDADYLKIRCDIAGKIISISFIDNGKTFNPLTDSQDPDITASVEDRKIGGLGIFMVKKIMDSTDYQRIENQNIFTMKIKSEEV